MLLKNLTTKSTKVSQSSLSFNFCFGLNLLEDHKAMCFDASETPFIRPENLCFYVFNFF